MPGHAGFAYGFAVHHAGGTDRWFLRLPPPNVQWRGTADMLRQVTALEALEGSAVPHCTVRWSGGPDDLEWFGRPYFVVEQLADGSVVGMGGGAGVGHRLTAAQRTDDGAPGDGRPRRHPPRRVAGPLRLPRRAGVAGRRRHPLGPLRREGRRPRGPRRRPGAAPAAARPDAERRPTSGCSTATSSSPTCGTRRPASCAPSSTGSCAASAPRSTTSAGWPRSTTPTRGPTRARCPTACPAPTSSSPATPTRGASRSTTSTGSAPSRAYKFAIITGFNLALHRRGKRPDPLWERIGQSIGSLQARARQLLDRVAGRRRDLRFPQLQ